MRRRQNNSWYLSALSALVVFLRLSLSVADQQQWPLPDDVAASLMHEIPVLHTAFVQTGEELHYMSTQIRHDSGSYLRRVDPIGSNTAKKKDEVPTRFNVLKLTGKGTLPIEFDPPMLDFGDNSVGSAQKRKIYVRNMLNVHIVLDVVVVNSIEFHASFFDTINLEPLGTSVMDVVFLPREMGKRQTTMHIYSSVGIFSYRVMGNCDSNPYRISPFVGYRIPFNGSLSKPLVLHNPHPYTLRVTEISSSGGNAHIEMPHGVDEKYAEEPPQYWDIRPYQSKKVANVMLVGAMTENSTLFVRVAGELHKSMEEKVPIKDIILTVPIEVSKQKGVYSTDEILDFGLLRLGEKSNPLVFSVAQYQLAGRLEFETLYVEKGDHTGIYMEFASNPPIVVNPPVQRNQMQPGPKSDLVKVYFDASRVEFPDDKPSIRHFAGSIVAVSRGGNYNISMPFRADVFQGNLNSVGNDLALQEELRPPHQRIIRIENSLPFDVAVWNISMSSDAAQYFSVRMVQQVVSIRAGDIAPVFVLKYNKKVPSNFDNAMFYVFTNASTFRVYLQKFSGRMSVELTSVDKQSFDFGFVERNDTRTIRFIVWNHNRAEMRLKKLSVPSRQAYRLYEVGTQKKGDLFSDVSNDERIEYVQATDVDISPQSGKVFDLELKVPQDGSVQPGHILFETDYESKLFRVACQVSTGSLQSIPDEVSFGQTFPAKLVYRTLQVFNSFDEDMMVTRLTTLSQDPRFFFEGFDPTQPPLLRSGRLTNLGRVMFSPQIPCSHEYCYLGFPLHTNDGQWFVHGLTLPANLAEVDAYLYKKTRAKYDALVKSGKTKVNTTIILDTDKAKNIKLKTSAELIWPRLLTRNSIQFPLTALGNFTIVNLTLSNPTSVPIAVQVIPLVIYPDAEALVELFRPHLLTPLSEHVEMNETLMFSLRDTELFTLKSDSPVPKLREELEAIIPHSVPRFTLSLLLKPHMKVRLRLGFLPSDYTLRSSLLLIRNNLTVMEPVVMYGKGARIGMKVENVEARSKHPLLFEIRHDHLTDCNNPKRLMHKLHSTLTVRRPFQVVNSGEVQFTVTNMSINGVPCENRGFRILNCYPFKLQPNESYALDIAYTPDFLTTTNEADLLLYMHMNGSAWVFPLAATVPGDMLAKCHQALPRPPFENIMYYSCATALIFCLVCVLACAYLEGDRAIACAIRQQFATPRHVFDLNSVAKQVNSGTKEKEKEQEEKKAAEEKRRWAQNSPSAIPVADDAWFVKRWVIAIANMIVGWVHSVWKWSLFYRKDVNDSEKTSSSKAGKNKKKKNLVSVVNAKKKQQNNVGTISEEAAFTTPGSSGSKSSLAETTNNNKETTPNVVVTATNQMTSKKGVTPVNTKNTKSPKATTNNLRKNSRKKSIDVGTTESASNLQVQQDNVAKSSRDSSRHSGKATGVQNTEKQNTKKVKQEQQKASNKNQKAKTTLNTQEMEDVRAKLREKVEEKRAESVARRETQNVQKATEEKTKKDEKADEENGRGEEDGTDTAPPVDPALFLSGTALPPMGEFDEATLAMLQQMMSTENLGNQLNMWNPAMTAAAMQFMSFPGAHMIPPEWNYAGMGARGVHDMQMPMHYMETPICVTPTPSVASMDMRKTDWNGEDEEVASVGSGQTNEDQPDWIDEEINADDAETDFSSMSAATKGMLMSDGEEDRGNVWSRDAFNSQANGARQRSPSVASSVASSTLSKRLDGSPQKMGGRRLTIGSEKKDLVRNKNFARTPGHARDEEKTPMRGQKMDLGTGLGTGADTGLGSMWPVMPDLSSLLQSTSSSQSSGMPTTSSSNTLWGSPVQDPLSMYNNLGMDLGPIGGRSREETSAAGNTNGSGLPEFGNTIFAGHDFNVWSDSSFDPKLAWGSLFGGPQQNSAEKEDEKDKEK